MCRVMTSALSHSLPHVERDLYLPASVHDSTYLESHFGQMKHQGRISMSPTPGADVNILARNDLEAWLGAEGPVKTMRLDGWFSALAMGLQSVDS